MTDIKHKHVVKMQRKKIIRKDGNEFTLWSPLCIICKKNPYTADVLPATMKEAQ